MRGGEPTPKLTLAEIFVLLGEKDPEALETFKTLFSKDFMKAMDYPHKENKEVYDDDTLETNPSLKNMAINTHEPPPYTYPVGNIISNLSISTDNLKELNLPFGTKELKDLKDIFEKYQNEAPYTNEVIVSIMNAMTEFYHCKNVKLRDALLAAAQREANLPEGCFVVTPEPSKYDPRPKPEFSLENLKKLLEDKPDLKTIFTGIIKNARGGYGGYGIANSTESLNTCMLYIS
jgi:hypothetical protein